MYKEADNSRFTNFFKTIKEVNNLDMRYLPETITHYYMVDKYHIHTDFKTDFLKNTNLVFKDEEQRVLFEQELNTIQAEINRKYLDYPLPKHNPNYGKKILEIIEKI